MTVTLPEHIGDITLKQYQEYSALEDLSEDELNKRKIEIFAGISIDRFNDINQSDVDGMLTQINFALTQDVEFKPRFKMKGIEFGFIPNFDKITAGEWGDISKYNTDIETMNRLMAILFRPIVKADSFGNYNIASYKGTEEYAELMLETPMDMVQGALVFFYNLAKELQIAIPQSMEKELRKVNKHQTSLIIGDGMLHSLN